MRNTPKKHDSKPITLPVILHPQATIPKRPKIQIRNIPLLQERSVQFQCGYRVEYQDKER